MADFKQLTKELAELGSGTTRFTIGARISSKNLKEWHEDLQSTIRLLQRGLGDVARTVATGLKDRVVARAGRFTPGVMDAAGTRSGIWTQDEQISAFQAVLREIDSSVRISGNGRAGFASRSALDSITLAGFPDDTVTLSEERDVVEGSDDEGLTRSGRSKKRTSTSSPYNVMWQIAEFGTGIYASPNKRLSGASKVPGGGGAWVVNPNIGNVIILGAKGGHFLFPEREHIEEARADLNFARDAVDEIITEYLQGRRRR